MTVISGQMAWARAAFANMRCGIVYRLVGPDDHVENIVKAKWCGDVEAVVGLKAHTQCVHNRCVTREGLIGAAKRRVVRTEALFEPEVNPRLIANVDGSGQVSHTLGYAL